MDAVDLPTLADKITALLAAWTKLKFLCLSALKPLRLTCRLMVHIDLVWLESCRAEHSLRLPMLVYQYVDMLAHKLQVLILKINPFWQHFK